MALVIKEVSSNTVTEVGNVIIIEGGGLSPDQSTKIDNLPTNTITSLAAKVDKVTGKGLSTNDYDATDKAKVDNVPANTNTSLSGKVDKVTGKGLSTNDFDNTYKGQLDNAPSNINTSLAAKADLVGGKVPTDQLPASITGGIAYQSAWNASTNTPTLSDATGTSGYQYKVDVAGSQDLGSGSISYDIGDILIHNGVIWEKFDQTETITSVNGQTGVVTITVPTALADLSEDTTHRVVTDTEKTTWNAKADTGDIPTALSELSQDATHRIVTDTEKSTWNGKADPGDIPTTLDDLTATSTSARISAAEKASYLTSAVIDGLADAISITGTHVETTTAIDFSTVQGKSITLTANRSYTISGLSASNPIGILQITHAGFTPSFSGVTALDSALDKSGLYYLKFTRQADGTITQSNQSGGGASTVEELSGVTATTNEVNKLNALLAGFKPGTPSIVTSLSGSDITITITPGTADSRFATTHYNIYRSTDGETYSLYDTEATTTYLDAGLTDATYYYYVTTENAVSVSTASNIDSESVVNWEFEYDFVTATYSGSPNNLPTGWVQLIGTQNGSTELIEKVTDQGMRFLCTADMGVGHYNNPTGVEINTDYQVQIDIDTFTSGAIYILGLATPSPAISTSGTHTHTVNTGSWNRILIRRSGSGSDCIISAIRWKPA